MIFFGQTTGDKTNYSGMKRRIGNKNKIIIDINLPIGNFQGVFFQILTVSVVAI